MEESNRENNKDHISQSRGSALDREEHIGEWRNPIGKITKITFPSQEGPLLTVKNTLENGGFNRENKKDHISQSRGSALDGEEHVGEWINQIRNITKITFRSQEGPLLTVKNTMENGGIPSGKQQI